MSKTTAALALAILTIGSANSSLAQRQSGKPAHAPQTPKPAGTLTINASLSYQFGGTQPVAGTEFIVLDENPQEFTNSSIAVYETAVVLHESFQIAANRIRIAQARQSGHVAEAEQLEDLLRLEMQNERVRQQLAFAKGETPREDDSVTLIRERLSPHIIARGVTNNYGIVTIRGLPVGQEIYVLGATSTRGGAAVWSLGVTLRRNQNPLVLDQANALVAF